MKRISFQLFLILFFNSISNGNFCWATAIRTFENTFKIERSSDGKLERITLKKLPQNNLIEADFMQSFVDDLVKSQEEVRYHGTANFIETEMELSEWPSKVKKDQEQINEVLKRVSVEPTLKHPKLKEALSLLASESQNDEFNFRVIAVPNNPTYFSSNETALKLVVRASGIITLVAGGSFGVSAGIFMVQAAFDMILERRTYFQNYFLYHLERYGPEKYGLTKAEAELVKSSIYESRIRFWDMWEKNKARVDWDKYGHNKYLDQVIEADKRRKNDSGELSVWGNRLGFAFNSGESSGYKRIVNLFNPRSLFSKKSSHGYEFQSPTKLRTKRLLYFLSQLAVRLSPVPVVSGVYNHFVESLYVPQRQTEGGLYAYFCDNGAEHEAGVVVQQSVNPFVITEVGN